MTIEEAISCYGVFGCLHEEFEDLNDVRGLTLALMTIEEAISCYGVFGCLHEEFEDLNDVRGLTLALIYPYDARVH